VDLRVSRHDLLERSRRSASSKCRFSSLEVIRV
jgi:hypothetical protein